MAQDFGEHRDIRTSAIHIRAAQFSHHKQDKLAERIGMLTLPRERDHVPEGLVDSLPPEGRLIIKKLAHFNSKLAVHTHDYSLMCSVIS